MIVISEQAIEGSISESKVLPFVFLAVAAILWSSAGLLIKFIPWNPIAISGLRSGIASLVLLSFWWFKTKTFFPKITKYKFIAAVNYVFLVTFFVIANKLTTSANAIFLQFTAPAWVLLISIWILKETVSKKDSLVVLCVFAGMMLFFVGDLETGNMLGNIFGVLSGIAMAWMIISLNKIKNGSPIEIIILGNIFTFLISIPFCRNLDFTQSSVVGIGLLGIFQLGIAYIFFATAIQKVSALEGILIPVLEPLLNPVWVLIGTGERPVYSALAGGVIVISAILYKNITDYKDSIYKNSIYKDSIL